MKFNPQKAIEKAKSDNYVIEMLLDPEEADEFEYLSNWKVKGKTFRVVAKLKHDDKVLVQARFIPHA